MTQSQKAAAYLNATVTSELDEVARLVARPETVPFHPLHLRPAALYIHLDAYTEVRVDPASVREFAAKYDKYISQEADIY
tara:strand:+ start:206 stop:445 length:240 start_codon:yes stop_codon:yes gene_type:complete